jgi:metal-sulfur cluster biosynthetic enzyme
MSISSTPSASAAEAVEARIWEALRHVEDPEIPVSVIGMGLIVAVAYNADDRAAELEITFTAMGCPATDFIEDDIREALLADPAIDEVRIEVVWDPIWTKDRIRAEARQTMRELGILV